MPKPSAQRYIDTRKVEIDTIIFLRRLFSSELRKLRNLPAGELSRHWYCDDTLVLTYKVKFLDMRDSARFLDKFANICDLSTFTSDDSDSGVRTFRASLTKGEQRARLSLVLEAEPFSPEENPSVKCRKVQVGVDTHTYTSTTPRYELICD